MAQAQPHVVFHLAAQPLVRLSYQQPVETLETNVMGTVHVLEAVRATPSVQAVVVVTSDKCYQNNEWVWGYRETDPMGGHDPYSASKGIAELVVSSYRNSYFSEHAHPSFRHPALLASGRAGNVIGGGDWALDRIIPDAVRAAATGAVLQVRNPVATRPWQHVLEPLSGYLEIGQKLLEGNPAFAQAWNFGPEDASSVSVQKVVGLFQEHWPDLQVAFNAQPAGQLHEAMLLKLDVSKAWHYLKWQPVWGLAQTLAHTTLWYRQYYQQHTNARTLSLQDLTTFAQAAQQMGLGWAS
jgi:CDP-glucose 4,6-dehydratase